VSPRSQGRFAPRGWRREGKAALVLHALRRHTIICAGKVQRQGKHATLHTVWASIARTRPRG